MAHRGVSRTRRIGRKPLYAGSAAGLYGGGAQLQRTASGLLVAQGTATNAHVAGNWTASSAGGTVSTGSGRLIWTPDNQAGTTYEPATYNNAPVRTRQWIVAEVGRFFATAAWLAAGVGNAANRDFLGLGTKINENLNGQRTVSIDNGALTTLTQVSDTHVHNVLYLQASKFDLNGTEDGLTVQAYDAHDDQTVGSPDESTVLGTSARLAVLGQDGFQVEYGRIWVFSDWLLPVTAPVPDSSLARVINGAEATVASATFSSESASLDLHAAIVTGAGTVDPDDFVQIGIRNAADTEWLYGPITPSADPTWGETIVGAGDTWAVA